MTEYMSYKNAMEYLDIKSYKSLTKLIALGLPTIQVGKSKYISKMAIDNFMKEHEVINATYKKTSL